MAFILHSKNQFYKNAVEDSSGKGSTKGLMYPPFLIHITTNKDIAIIKFDIYILELNC
jgi:hypothetical protein